MRYIIWSEEHNAWWRDDKMGYTHSIIYAGRFEQREACEIVKTGNRFLDPGDEPPLNEIAIPDPLVPAECMDPQIALLVG
jgi:hypothetical protein